MRQSSLANIPLSYPLPHSCGGRIKIAIGKKKSKCTVYCDILGPPRPYEEPMRNGKRAAQSNCIQSKIAVKKEILLCFWSVRNEVILPPLTDGKTDVISQRREKSPHLVLWMQLLWDFTLLQVFLGWKLRSQNYDKNMRKKAASL